MRACPPTRHCHHHRHAYTHRWRLPVRQELSPACLRSFRRGAAGCRSGPRCRAAIAASPQAHPHPHSCLLWCATQRPVFLVLLFLVLLFFVFNAVDQALARQIGAQILPTPFQPTRGAAKAQAEGHSSCTDQRVFSHQYGSGHRYSSRADARGIRRCSKQWQESGEGERKWDGRKQCAFPFYGATVLRVRGGEAEGAYARTSAADRERESYQAQQEQQWEQVRGMRWAWKC